MAETLKSRLDAFLKKRGLNNGKVLLDELKSGGNNKVFRMKTEDGTYLLKVYFRHSCDIRRRLKNEFEFSKFAWKAAKGMLPEPICADNKLSIGLYEFISGEKITEQSLNKGHLSQALDFVLKLNSSRNEPEAKMLPAASDACFSIKKYIDHVDYRIVKLKNIDVRCSPDRQATCFIDKKILPEWNRIKDRLKNNLGNNTPLRASEKCVSPSDFGFHNALECSNGKVKFIDFEYAGWDDPAKMICDFFCQPEVPVPLSFFDKFVGKISNIMGYNLQDKALSLMDTHRIKWCCIMLNEFLHAGNMRRCFADRERDIACRKKRQLSKVREYFALHLE